MGDDEPAALPRLALTLEKAEAADAQCGKAHPGSPNVHSGTPLFQRTMAVPPDGSK